MMKLITIALIMALPFYSLAQSQRKTIRVLNETETYEDAMEIIKNYPKWQITLKTFDPEANEIIAHDIQNDPNSTFASTDPQTGEKNFWKVVADNTSDSTQNKKAIIKITLK